MELPDVNYSFIADTGEVMSDNESVNTIDILYTLDSASNYSAIQKIEAVIAVSGRSHEMRRFVCFLFLKHGT